jgi:hypothetical protein
VRILNFSSGLVRFTFPGKVAYAVSKSAIEPLARYVAMELAPRGIPHYLLRDLRHDRHDHTAGDHCRGTLRHQTLLERDREPGEDPRVMVAYDIGLKAAAEAYGLAGESHQDSHAVADVGS